MQIQSTILQPFHTVNETQPSFVNIFTEKRTLIMQKKPSSYHYESNEADEKIHESIDIFKVICQKFRDT